MLSTVVHYLSLLVVFTMPCENMVMVQGVGTLSRLAGLALAAAWLTRIVLTGQLRKPQLFHLAALLFIAWNGASLVWSIDTQATFGRVQTYLQLFALLYILWDLYRSPAALRGGLQAYVLGAYVSLASMAVNFRSGLEVNSERYAASGFNPNDFGLILALGIPVAWHLALHSGSGPLARLLTLLNGVYPFAAALGIALTGSRGTLVAASGAGLYLATTLLHLRLRWHVFIGLLFILAAAAVASYLPAASLERLATTGQSIHHGDLGGRVRIWREGYELFARDPLLGVGCGAYSIAAGRPAHNVFLSVLVEVGLVGLCLFAWVLALSVYHASSQPRWLSRFWMSVLLVWVLGAFVHTWEQRKQTWLFLGLPVASARARRSCPARGASVATDRLTSTVAGPNHTIEV
jgi:O-antigen ligase